MKIINFATSNVHKVSEAAEILNPFGIRVNQVDLEIEEPQADKIEDIAEACAIRAAMRLKKPVVVEDSGLFISALGGFPGPYSSYVYRTIGLEGILRLMRGCRDRTARFESTVAYSRNEKRARIFKGVATGRITDSARGRGGFGFDPIFMARGRGATFAELDLCEKNSLSHRGKAFRAFANWYTGARC